MNDERRSDERVERSLRVWLTEGRPPLADREAQIDSVLGRLDEAPQARRRFLGRWLDRGEGARRRTDRHDHPPDIHRRNRLMFSATGLVAAFAVLALSVSVVNTTDPSPPGAGAGATHVVAADGSGDFSTIAAAVEAAADGDTILVNPGTYTEAIVIDKDITLAGDGPRDEIVIVALDDPPTAEVGSIDDGADDRPEPYALRLEDSDATVSGLTFRGEAAEVHASGGAPTLEGLTFDAVGVPFRSGGTEPSGMVLTGGTRAIVRDNSFVDGGPINVFDGSEPVIEDNVLTGGPHIAGGFGDGATVTRNTVTDTLVNGIAILNATTVLIEDNVITDVPSTGIFIGFRSSPGVDPVVRGNTISRTSTGISVAADAAPAIDLNEITDTSTGISVTVSEPMVTSNVLNGNDLGIILSGSDATVEGNSISSGTVGIAVVTGGSPSLIGNTVEGASTRGIAVMKGTSPTLRNNTVCGSATNLFVGDEANPVLEGNEICPDTPAEASE